MIDFVAPPYAGHLFPLLDLARSLSARGMSAMRVVSTPDAAPSIRLCGLEPVEILGERVAEVWAVANTHGRAGLHPLRLYHQFRANMALMGDLAAQLRTLWTRQRPELVIADFTIPIAGIVARQLGIRWWTSTPSPCAIETHSGTPSYLGGWMPAKSLAGRARDACGRAVIRSFKLGIAGVFGRELRELGFASVYRHDGTEAVYSDECILGFGMREFEFERDDWPRSFHFIGPVTGGPEHEHAAPEFVDGRPAILVTLGTHLPWARQRAADLIDEVAERMPDCNFHVGMGQPGSRDADVRRNVRTYGYIPYDRYLPRYSASIHHAGTGIVYSCIRAGVPMLVWPHDYDQHDHAARVVHRGLGIRLTPRADEVVRSLRRILSDDGIRERAAEFRDLAARYDPAGWMTNALGVHPERP
jgi:UDP:flavonoid glycosyltransferase YjiC (YdhE family)